MGSKLLLEMTATYGQYKQEIGKMLQGNDQIIIIYVNNEFSLFPFYVIIL